MGGLTLRCYESVKPPIPAKPQPGTPHQVTPLSHDVTRIVGRIDLLIISFDLDNSKRVLQPKKINKIILVAWSGDYQVFLVGRRVEDVND